MFAYEGTRRRRCVDGIHRLQQHTTTHLVAHLVNMCGTASPSAVTSTATAWQDTEAWLRLLANTEMASEW